MSSSDGITEAEDGTLTWITDHGDKVTVYREAARRGDRHEWRWNVKAAGNHEVVGGNESHPQRLAAKAAAIRHHPPAIVPPALDTLVGATAILEQTANPAEVGFCRYCGQQLIRTATDCWHPHTVERACPPEHEVDGLTTAAWGTFFRPGRDAFVTAKDEAYVREHTEGRGLIYAGGDALANYVWSGPAEQLAAQFHDHYERLAPAFGYDTRDASAKPWPQVPDNNRRLMTAVLISMTEGPDSPLVARARAIDVHHLARQAAWSTETFGPGSRGGGVTDHIKRELDKEVHEGQPNEDPQEWIDVVILALDGAWRAGLSPQQIVDGVKAKQAKNESRQWPDWRTAEPGKAIEHDRTRDADDA